MVSVGSVTVDVLPDASRFNDELSAKLNPGAQRAGKQISDMLAEQIAQGIRKGLGDFPTDNPAKEPARRKGSDAAGAFGDAFKARMRSALADLPKVEINADSSEADRALASIRAELQSLHDAKLGVDISTTDALTKADVLKARLDALGASAEDIRVKVDTRAASLELDKFLAEYRVKTEVAAEQVGEDNGSILAQGMRNSFMRNSPLIAAAIGGGLALGAPVIAAGGVAMFAGLAAVAVHSNEQLQAIASQVRASIKSTFVDAAQVTVPMFERALVRVGDALSSMRPQFSAAFSTLDGPIDSLTTGLLEMVQNLMPGLIRMLQAGGPVFQGLSVMLADIGSGLGKMFDLISQHGDASGTVLRALGQIVQNLLPIVGQLISAGVELASNILPPVASALGLVARVLDRIAPVLPGIVAGFIGFKAVSALDGPLMNLAGRLGKVSEDGTRAIGALGTLQAGLPAIGVVVASLGAIWQQSQQQLHQWAQALLDGGAAATQAKAQIEQAQSAWVALSHIPILSAPTSVMQPFANAFGVGTNAMDSAKKKADELKAAMSPLQQKQQDVTKATNDLQQVLADPNHTAADASAASDNLARAQSNLADFQSQVNVATQKAQTSFGDFKGELQTTADAASAANAQIGLLKTSLDALTGKTISMGQAEVAVTNATVAATTALQGKAGALVDATGKLNLHTEAGAAAFTALTNLAGADNQLIATMEQQGATTDQVKAKDAELRDSFIQTAIKMGLSSEAAHNLADQIYGIPDQRTTQINANTADASAAIKNIQDQIDNLHGRQVTIQVLADASGPGGAAGPAAYAVPGSGTGGYAQGGYTGPGGKYTPAGIVHAGEFVFPQESVKRLGVGFLGALAGLPGYADGGPVVNYLNINTAPFNSGIQAAANSMRDRVLAAASSAGGAAQWASVALQALSMEGQSSSWLGLLLQRMNQESGGNPYAINLWDSNAAAGDPSRGLMQTIGATFSAYHDPRTSWDIYDPLANIAAAIRYTLARYGTLSAWGQPGGYELGTNWVPQDQLAYLHKGEAVVPAKANQGAPWQAPNLTVIAQFGAETIEAKVVRIVDKATGQIADAYHYAGGGH